LTTVRQGYQFLVGVFSILLLLQETNGQTFQSVDLGEETSFQDTVLGHHKRGRACLAADFNLDGHLDFYMGNPGDESFVLRAEPQPGGSVTYVLEQVLVVGELTWAGVTLDYDNDGDPDIFICNGGNEGTGLDYLFRNDWILDGVVTGSLDFTDVTNEAGVAGIVPDGETEPIATASAGAVVADYDLDGDSDIFVSSNLKALRKHQELEGRNILWRNNGDGTFTDVTNASGLGVSLELTRHSTFFDYDNDGDPDLYENNYLGYNILWRNNGDGTFTDVTAELSAPGHDLSYPYQSFASAAADFNNDGWDDLIVFMRGSGGPGPNGDNDCGCNDCPVYPAQPGNYVPGIYPDGHALFMNRGGTAFENIVETTHLNDAYVSDSELGVMGCQVGDVSGDGIPDVYIGNGGPYSGYNDQLFLSIPDSTASPVFVNMTSLIDFPAIVPPGIPEPPYPYRTHGVCFVDFDNDGTLEIAVSNGGPAGQDDEVREPNRLFKFTASTPFNYFKVRPIGDGITVSKDAFGTRVALTVTNPGGDQWTLHKTLFGGSAFSAQNGNEVVFGLADADAIESMVITWPGGESQVITEGLTVNSSVTIMKDPFPTGFEPSPTANLPGAMILRTNYPNPFNPSTTIRYELEKEGRVTLQVYDLLGQRVRTLFDDVQPAGESEIVWDGADNAGRQVPSGVYISVLRSGNSFQSRKMVLTK
jgi:hypothetical protein